MIKNKLSEYKTDMEKMTAFWRDSAAGALAWDASGRQYPLREQNLCDVEFVAGAWRVQNKFDAPLQTVRDSEFVLTRKLNRVEKNLFEFYGAKMVGLNCYGYFIVGGPDMVVAKYTTRHQTYWSYGRTLEEARAFMGIKLYDVYQDLIHRVACGKERKK